MANVERYTGDSQGVVSMDRSLGTVAGPVGAIISTGLTERPVVYKITTSSVVDFTAEMGVGGAVEQIIRVIEAAATVTCYQIDYVSGGNATNGTQISLMAERSGWSDAALTAAIQAIGSRAADPTIPVDAFNFAFVSVASVEGFKLA